jgi:hypothetical protein
LVESDRPLSEPPRSIGNKPAGPLISVVEHPAAVGYAAADSIAPAPHGIFDPFPRLSHGIRDSLSDKGVRPLVELTCLLAQTGDPVLHPLDSAPYQVGGLVDHASCARYRPSDRACDGITHRPQESADTTHKAAGALGYVAGDVGCLFAGAADRALNCFPGPPECFACPIYEAPGTLE